MVKKRVRDAEVLPEAPPIEDSDDEDMDMVDVDFEFFNYKPDVDFHGLKALLRQLLDVDAQLFNLSELSDLVLSQPTIGSTVKVDGEDTDAYAIMTILNLYEHREKSIIRDLTRYLTEKAKSSQTLALVADLLSSSKHVGLVLAERMINVPAELSPPMYTMLIDEIEAAVEDKEPYEFTHYLIVSKTYREVASTLDQEDAPKSKKNKATNGNKETFYFHPEDEVLQNHALAYGAYEYTKDAGEGMADSKRAFSDMGIKTQGSMILIEASKFQGAAEAIGKYISPQ